MARHNIKARDLADEMSVSANSVSNLRNSRTMPRLDGEILNNLCEALNRLAQDLEGEISPSDLISYVRGPNPVVDENYEIKGVKASIQHKKSHLTNSEAQVEDSLVSSAA
ncbi:helix-turn-helix transcriptional regulator [Komarekiella sp. 'clone 1']|uniref:Helix-turn-helix transcriptional regulator n=2 Tax=Komarekiella TaxID=2022127 RepID=A0AA40T4L5_9NOST|nr:helix-turn-helix transcriptional regulator [Komarekiella delphini-convector SJRDD-AB1]